MVHVFTLVLARVLPAFGYALASWTDTSHRGAGLSCSLFNCEQQPSYTHSTLLDCNTRSISCEIGSRRPELDIVVQLKQMT
jgi:hypothetical protein